MKNIYKNKKICTAIVHSTILIIGLVGGWYVHKWHYTDVCLDMGGGINPGGYEICIVDTSKNSLQ